MVPSVTSTPLPELLESAEVCERLGISTTTLHNYATSGKLPAAKKLAGPRGPRLWLRSDVEAFAADLAAEHSAKAAALSEGKATA